MFKKKLGFTLAEVLITLAIIGVVAAMTIPTLVSGINDRVRENRLKTISAKLHQGTDKLTIMEHINGYGSTEEFVTALGKHMKITSVCSADEIGKCFPYDKIKLEDGTEVEVNDIKTPAQLGLTDGNSAEWSDPVSFVTADGIPYIVSYNTKCAIDDGNGRANTTACLAGVYDWNGTKLPNKFGVEVENSKTKPDVLSLNSGGIVAANGAACSLTVGDICFSGAPFLANKIEKKCTEVKAKYGEYVKSCNSSSENKDYWANAVWACGEQGKRLPDKDELTALAQYLYNDSTITDSPKYPLTRDAELMTTLFSGAENAPGSTSRFSLWSSEENGSSSAYNRDFDSLSTGWRGLGRSLSDRWAVCVAP